MDSRALDVVDSKENEDDEAEGDWAAGVRAGPPPPPGGFLSHSARLVLDADDITGFARLEVRRDGVSQGVKGLLVQMACGGWGAVSGH